MLPFREYGPHTPEQTDAAEGSAPAATFVLLHFFGGSHREWEGVVAPLQKSHRVIAADMAGFGEAAALDGFTVQDMAGRICDLLHYLEPSPVVLVAHSMSGKAAMVVAANPPANVQGVVLVAPSPLSGEPMSDSARADMRIANTSRKRAEQFTRNGFANTPSEQLLEVAVEDVLRSSDDAFHAWADLGTREDWSDRVQRFGVRTSLVVGEKDKAIDPDLQRRETLPLVEASGGSMHLVPNCAHLVPYERPVELARMLQQFAKEVGQGCALG